MQDDIERLNERFGIAGRIEFCRGRGGFRLLRAHNEAASVEVSLYGGQVLDFRHLGEAENRLFLSGSAHFESGRAIKGGIPICWPWFGADPDDKGRAAHGFVRTRDWEVRHVHEVDATHTEIELALHDDEETRALWPFAFQLSLRIVFGPELTLSLTTRNRDERSFAVTQALHTYLAVDEISHAQVHGLDGLDYLDKPLDFAQLRQGGPVLFDQEIDRVYMGVDHDITLIEPRRRIVIHAHGSHTAVVWNPWQKVAQMMDDLGNDDYRRFICIETANAADEVITLGPGERTTLGASYRWTAPA